MRLRNYASINFLFIALIAVAQLACSKQEAPSIESGYSEKIDRKRLESCSRMNLFDDLLEHSNTVALFDCTNWDQQFPLLRQQLGQFTPQHWNNLMLPVSQHSLNDRNTLKQAIAVTQGLDQKDGLDDLGRVLTSLHDTNFYDGMNELFSCAAGGECSRPKPVSKNSLIDAFGILEVSRHESEGLHVLFANAVTSLEVLGPSFRDEVFKVLSAPEFIQKRVVLVDLLVEFLTMPRGDFERRLLPTLANTDDEENIFSWINSAAFSPQLFKDLNHFLKKQPQLVADIRSLGQIRRAGLKCASFSNTTSIFFNLDQYLYTLAKKMASLDGSELDGYLVEDLLLHNAIVQACPNLQNLETTIDGKSHSLDILRLKHSLAQLFQISGVKPLGRIVAKKMIEASNGDKKALGDFLEQQTEKDYLGAIIDFYDIIERTSPTLFGDFVTYAKSLPLEAYGAGEKVMAQLVDQKLDAVWPAWNGIWHFFDENEKNFLFNYLDRHFEKETNYLALMNFYLEIFTVIKPDLPDLVAAWLDDARAEKNFDGLKELAQLFHGKEILQEFKTFFARNHILKAIELFINGEQLTAWAASVKAALPATSLNQTSFYFSASDPAQASRCLEDIGANDLDILLKSFPSNCASFENEVFVKRIALLAGLNREFTAAGFNSPFTADALLAAPVLEDFIVMGKKAWDAIEQLGIEKSKFISWMESKFASPEVLTVINESSRLIDEYPKRENSLFKEKILLEISSFLKDQDNLATLASALNEMADWRRQGLWRETVSRKYAPQVASHACDQKFNSQVGEDICPDLETFTEFVRTTSELMIRKNDEHSPLAIRQFIRALDPGAGIFIPYQGTSGAQKHLSIAESLKMFWELTDPSREVNQISIPYTAKGSTTKQQKVTTLERVEIVIRDVNFDSNYLGAHYKNSVAKSYDYTKVVNSKFGMFKFCVGAGFCGKFMNREEKRLAANAVAAFPALLDVENNDLRYGDYMKALLSAVVSSSSKSSQTSTMVRFRRDRDGFNIPWLQSKKQLRKHNGVILSELARIGAFTNMARWFLDRFGRTPEDYRSFMASPELKLINENLLNNFDTQVTDQTLTDLLQSLSSSSGILLVEDLWQWIEKLPYQDLRRVEDVVGDALIIVSAVNKEDSRRDWDGFLKLTSWAIKNYPLIKKHWGDTELLALVKNIQPWSDFVASQMVKDSSPWRTLVAKLFHHGQNILVDERERVSLLSLVQSGFSSNQARSFGAIAEQGAKLLASSETEDDEVVAAALQSFGAVFAAPNNSFGGLSSYLERSANTRACRYEGELVLCAHNTHYLEPFELISFVAGDEKRWKNYVAQFFVDPQSLSEWMSESLGLIRLINP